jgi:hypothetical protein
MDENGKDGRRRAVLPAQDTGVPVMVSATCPLAGLYGAQPNDHVLLLHLFFFFLLLRLTFFFALCLVGLLAGLGSLVGSSSD